MLSLSDALANAFLFAGDAKTDSCGLVKILVLSNGVQFSSYDDYIYLEQFVETSQSARWSDHLIDKKVLKELGEDGFWDGLAPSTQSNKTVEEGFDALTDNLHQFPEALLGGFTFPSDRFGKISRIKGSEPTVLTMGEDQGMKLAKFTKGPGVQGMMAFLEEGDNGE